MVSEAFADASKVWPAPRRATLPELQRRALARLTEHKFRDRRGVVITSGNPPAQHVSVDGISVESIVIATIGAIAVVFVGS